MNIILSILSVLSLLSSAYYVFQSSDPIEYPHTELEETYLNWKKKHSIQFNDPDTEHYRIQIFIENLEMIKEHNQQNESWTMGINQFMTMTNEEWKERYLTLETPDIQESEYWSNESKVLAPESVNWVEKGAVGPVKDQGQCGSCWAFSATGCLEGLFKIFGSGLYSFSEQQLVDCSSSYGNHGCNGGLQNYAYQYVEKNGLVLESQYPYVGKQTKCTINSGPYKNKTYKSVFPGSCSSLTNAVVNQPVSVAVDAQQWQFYSSGIFSKCGTSLDHGVLVAGYTNDYWYVKNSWGTSWGMQGYIELKRGNTCGICNQASFAVGIQSQ